MPAGNNIALSRCETRRKLAEQFAINARLFAEAVVMLTRDPAKMVPGEYEQLRAAAEEAQGRSESIGREFREHVDAHGCGQSPTGASNRVAADGSR